MRVSADERVGERLPVAGLDDAREVLEVHLVDDSGVRRDDLEVVECLLSPAQERVALAVPLELELRVAESRSRRRVLVDLDRVVDHELGRKLRVDAGRVAAEVLHRIPHPREVDDGGDACEVLVEHARRPIGDLPRRLVLRGPAEHGLGGRLLAVAERVLEQDPKRVGKPLRRRVEAEDLVAAIPDGEGGGGHPPRFYVRV